MRTYLRQHAAADLIAGMVTGVLLVPQALAYALLAGMPPQAGLYAAIVPAMLYAGFGTSRALSVGPVAVVSLMTAAIVGPIALGNPQIYAQCALVLALFAGVMLLGLGLCRLGFMVNFLSTPVLGGFTMGAALLILVSQLPQLFGVRSAPRGEDVIRQLVHLVLAIPNCNWIAPAMGIACIAGLLMAQGPMARWLAAAKLPPVATMGIVRAMPLLLVIVSSLLVALLGLAHSDLQLVGRIREGLPVPALPRPMDVPWRQLMEPAALLGLVAYLEGISVARVLARRRREAIDANREMVAIGLANIAAALTQAMPVAGSFTRSVVNDSAGARTRGAALISALLAALIVWLFAAMLFNLPRAVLAAIIFVAVMRLMDFKGLARVWRYDRGDGIAWVATAVGVVATGVETGLVAGIVLSLLLYIWRTANPRVTEVGRLAHTELFLEIERYHEVETWPQILLMRVDESLFFGNAAAVQSAVIDRLVTRPEVTEVVLICSAVNSIDAAAIEQLEDLDESLQQAGATLHLADVKGQVVDRFSGTRLAERLDHHRIHISTAAAIVAIASPPI